MYYSWKFWFAKCVISGSFGLRTVLFLDALVCEVCYSCEFWSAKCVIPGSFGLRAVLFLEVLVCEVGSFGL